MTGCPFYKLTSRSVLDRRDELVSKLEIVNKTFGKKVPYKLIEMFLVRISPEDNSIFRGIFIIGEIGPYLDVSRVKGIYWERRHKKLDQEKREILEAYRAFSPMKDVMRMCGFLGSADSAEINYEKRSVDIPIYARHMLPQEFGKKIETVDGLFRKEFPHYRSCL